MSSGVGVAVSNSRSSRMWVEKESEEVGSGRADVVNQIIALMSSLPMAQPFILQQLVLDGVGYVVWALADNT